MEKYWLGKDENNKAVLLWGKKPNGALILLPNEYEPVDVQFMYINESIVDDGLDQNGQPKTRIEYSIIVDHGSRDAFHSAKHKEKLVNKAYSKMDKDIFNKAALVFGTARADSAMVNYQDWILMRDYPTYYFNQGLVALIDVYDGATLIFSKGDALDSIDKIKTYAEKCLANAVQFSIYRQKRIVQFLGERETILNG